MSKVILAECRTYAEAEVAAATEKIFGALDAGRIFKAGEKILVKPNFLMPADDDKPSATHSQVVLALCRILLDIGCRVTIGESPGMGSLSACLARKNLAGPLRRLGIPAVEFVQPGAVALPSGRIVKSVPLAKEIPEFDGIVSAAKLKTHCQCYFTGAVKNLYGCLPGTLKPEYHLRFSDVEHFCSFLLDVYDAVKPRLGLIDAVVGMEGEGPSGGKAKAAGFLAASEDCLALDIEAMKTVSLKPDQAPYLREKARSGGYEVVRLGNIGETVFAPPRQILPIPDVIPLPGVLKRALRRLTVPVPVFSLPPACKLCGNCEKICPPTPKAAILANGRIIFRRGYCIRCYCCHEMCPHKAVRLSRPLLMRPWRRLRIPSL